MISFLVPAPRVPPLQLLFPIKLVISELAGQRIKKVISIVEEQKQILKALGAQKMPKIVP